MVCHAEAVLMPNSQKRLSCNERLCPEMHTVTKSADLTKFCQTECSFVNIDSMILTNFSQICQIGVDFENFC